MLTESLYPNPFELLRYILRALDLKQSNKTLDELASKKAYDPRIFKDALESDLFPVIEKYMGADIAQITTQHFERFITKYLQEIVAVIPADGLDRKSVVETLIKTELKNYFVEFAEALNSCVGGPHLTTMFSNTENAVATVLNWLKNNIDYWQLHISSLKKERKDMLSSWAKGNELPSAQSIYLLAQSEEVKARPHEADWQQIRTLLFLSRLIDFIKQDTLGEMFIDEVRVALWGAGQTTSVRAELSEKQYLIQQKTGNHLSNVARIQNDLRRTVEKANPEGLRALIDDVRALIQTSEYLSSTLYWIDWHEARWYVYSGDLQVANELYKKAFENALFSAGENQRFITEEAIVVAASLQNPDRVFLKQLKWSLIIFGYDIPSVSGDKPSQKVSDTIEDWEFEMWIAGFEKIFPKNGLFPGVEIDSSKAKIGPILMDENAVIKPDYRYPNRKIKVGKDWHRVMPQLVWFAQQGDYETCKKLLDQGADVNVSSEVGETPILKALQLMNVTEVIQPNTIPGLRFSKSLDDSLFWLFQKLPHTSKTINLRSQKTRLLPIISAVESGRLDVVEAVIAMGADVNARGKTDEQTPLNICINLIGIIKNPQRAKYNQLSMPITPKALDSMRRHSGGLSGFTLEAQAQSLKHMNHELRQEVQEVIIDLMYESILKHMRIDEMRIIAKLLIHHGADVNATHASPIKGYTPLMLAAELDEAELFDAMLIANGDLYKTYKDPKTGFDVTLANIAANFASKGVIQRLKDISPYTAL